MQRREFITLLGGAAATWSLPAHAQPSERVRRVGILTGIADEDPHTKARLTAFLQELQKLGWTEGRNVRIDARAAAGSPATIRKYAAEWRYAYGALT
jgi:putative ABC transport system substrate-binding protein